MTKDSKYITSGPGTVEIGNFVNIGENVQFIFSEPATLKIGDYCTIGSGVKIISSSGDISIGDWTSMHDNCLVLSGAYVNIGQHCWFGQNSIIDGSGGLRIGNGVRVGMYSQIWSHVAAGEQIEGCTLFGERPVEIEDDVWLVGSCIVASGLKIGRRTIALIGSNITKSWPENSVIAGSPAAAKSNLSFYREITLEEKWTLMNQWIDSVSKKFKLKIDRTKEGLLYVQSSEHHGKVIFVKNNELFNTVSQMDQATICGIENKIYRKKLTKLEWVLLKFLSGNKARFISQ